MGERADRRAGASVRARPGTQDRPARRRRGQARPHLHRAAAQARPAAGRRARRHRLHRAAGARRHRPGARPAAAGAAAHRAGHRHLPGAQPGDGAARQRADADIAEVCGLTPGRRPGNPDDFGRRGQPPGLLQRGTAAAGSGRARGRHPARAPRHRHGGDRRLPGRDHRGHDAPGTNPGLVPVQGGDSGRGGAGRLRLRPARRLAAHGVLAHARTPRRPRQPGARARRPRVSSPGSTMGEPVVGWV
jgi:hypothetical protein